uniref:Uncharacterized protein n=1 Tax=Glossina pallidipes TaxID=7398 RepID=A0A1A9Z3F6_GLOPL
MVLRFTIVCLKLGHYDNACSLHPSVSPLYVTNNLQSPLLQVLAVMACFECEPAKRFDVNQAAPKKNDWLLYPDLYIKNHCVKNLGNTMGITAYSNIEKESEKFKTCLNGHLNGTKLQAEMTKGSLRNNLKTIFSAYCEKKRDLTKCIENFSKQLTPCLDKNDRQLQKDAIRLTGKIFEFLCLNDGNQMVEFIINGGPECAGRHYKAIDKCIEPHFKEFDRSPFTVESCKYVNNVEKCVVNQLNTCPNKTAANIMQGLFRYLKEDTICRNK